MEEGRRRGRRAKGDGERAEPVPPAENCRRQTPRLAPPHESAPPVIQGETYASTPASPPLPSVSRGMMSCWPG